MLTHIAIYQTSPSAQLHAHLILQALKDSIMIVHYDLENMPTENKGFVWKCWNTLHAIFTIQVFFPEYYHQHFSIYNLTIKCKLSDLALLLKEL